MVLALDEREQLRSLRDARRSHFLETNDLLNVVVKFYFVAIAAGITIDVVSTSSKFFTFTSSDIAFVRTHGGAVGGIAFAFAIFLGVMAGTRGGPVTLFAPEMRLVFLSGVNTDRLLRAKALRAILHFAYIGAVAGLALGIALHNLRHASPVLAPLALGFYGMILGMTYGGAACLSLGLSLGANVGYLVGFVLVGYSVASALYGLPGDIFAIVGNLAVLFLISNSYVPLLGAALTTVVSIATVYLVTRADLEVIELHSELVSRLRFAIGTRDVRSVILLSRALTENGYRPRTFARNLYRILPGPHLGPLVRSIQSLSNWSIRRYFRLAVVIFGYLIVITFAWNGTEALYILAIPLAVTSGLELSDPMSNLIDKADIFTNYPVDDGWLVSRSLVAPLILSVLLSLGLSVIAYAIHPTVPLIVMLSISFSLAISSVLGGAVAGIRSGAPSGLGGLMTPETQALGLIIELIPVVIATAWLFPALNSHSAFVQHRPPDTEAISAAFFSLIVPLGAWAWIRSHKVLRTD